MAYWPLILSACLMPVGVLAALVVAQLARRSCPMGLADVEAARAAWNRLHPGNPALRVEMAPTGAAALVTARHGLGLIWHVGLDIRAGSLSGAAVCLHGRGLAVRFPVASSSRLVLDLPHDTAADWADRCAGATCGCDAEAPPPLGRHAIGGTVPPTARPL